MRYIGYIWEITINIIEAMLFMYLLLKTLNLKSYRKIYFILGLLLRIIMVSILNFLIEDSTIRLIIILAFDILLSVVCFENSMTEKILWGSNYIIIVLFADKITFWIANTFTNFKLVNLISIGYERYVMTLVYLVICVMLIKFFIYTKRERYFLPIHLRIIFVFLVLMGIIVSDKFLDLIIIADFNNLNNNIIFRMEWIGYIFLFILVSSIFVIEYAGKVLEQNYDLYQKNIQYKLEEKYYENVVSTVSMLRSWKHDCSTRLQVIYNFITQQKYEEAILYIEQLENNLQSTPRLITTGNSVVDSLMSVKLLEMKEKDIKFDYEIYLVPILPFSDLDFSALIGNILSNSIQACEVLDKEDEKYVKFIIKPYRDMLYIYSENSSSGHYLYNKDGTLKSTRRGEHGIGIKRIKEIVESSEGFCNIYPEERSFKIIIMVPIPVETKGEKNGN